MKARGNDAFVRGVSSGSWLPQPPRRSALVDRRVLRAIRPAKLRPLAARTDANLIAEQGDRRVLGLSVRRWAVLLLFVASVATLGALSALELMGTINLIPPDFSPPPSSSPSPPSPLSPPGVPAPPRAPAPPSGPPPPPLQPSFAVRADSSCHHAVGGQIVLLTNNNRCEDGGAGSAAAICELGTDYPDCPGRPVQLSPPPPAR